ncbi:DUF420 domain-containing protein [Schlesneria paludicola]|uniref:DUF420 domain-containing protein n=1 Tax=Schlesneria paludicola TaxID=360056 RepID=UPI00029A51F9|nr:DUF420 domain-containing protein [Schlesneria paludicola]
MTGENLAAGEISARQKRTRTRLITGGLLWVLCFAGLFWLWVQQRQKASQAQSEPNSITLETQDGRATKQIKLVPQKDGSFAAHEVAEGKDDSPWDAEGIEDFSFTDTDGKTVTKQDLLGKPFLIAFVFTHCLGPCPNVTRQMREIQDRLKEFDFNLVTLTVDPERDTTDVLKQYGSDQGANFERWKFLTGNQTDIYGLIQRSFKMPVEEAKGDARIPGFEIIHSTNIMLVNAAGKIVGKYNAQKDDEMAKLRKDLKRLIKPVSNSATLTDDDENPLSKLPAWAATLPAVNAGLNGLAGIMLLVGYGLIRQKRRTEHAWVMISAFVTSIIFLGCYLTYHYALHVYTGEPGKRFGHSGTLLGTSYLAILLTHVVLAAVVPVLAIMTLYRAWRQDWVRHRRIAKVTFPIWVYVSVTGVMIYVMLYHWPGTAP